MIKEPEDDLRDVFSEVYHTSKKKEFEAIEMSILIADLCRIYFLTFEKVLFYNRKKIKNIDVVVQAIRKMVESTVANKKEVNAQEKVQIYTEDFKFPEYEQDEYEDEEEHDQYQDDLMYIIERVEDDDDEDDEDDEDNYEEEDNDGDEEEMTADTMEPEEYFELVDKSREGVQKNVVISKDVEKIYRLTEKVVNELTGYVYAEMEIMMFLIIYTMPPELKMLIKLLDEDCDEVKTRNSEFFFSELKTNCGDYIFKKKETK